MCVDYMRFTFSNNSPRHHSILQPILAELQRVSEEKRSWLESFYFDGEWALKGVVELQPDGRDRFHLFWLQRSGFLDPSMPCPCIVVHDLCHPFFLLYYNHEKCSNFDKIF